MINESVSMVARSRMGGGGQMSSVPLQRFPHEKAPFTIADLKKAVPPHCFKKSVLRSFSYLVYDFTIIAIFYYIATTYFHLLPYPLISYLAWTLYATCVGCVLLGVWTIAHECGHHAFSDYEWLDDTVGLILHSSLLVPYFSFKYSHRHHHKSIGLLDGDEVYPSKLKSGISWFIKYMNNPPGRVLWLIGMFALAWPLYLMFNCLGRPYDRFACHFDPYSPIFSHRERGHVLISDAALLAVSYGLYHLAVAKGLAWVFCLYGGPLIVVNGLLIVTTYLQHTHPSLPQYDSSEWDWLRGVLSTMDRDYGIILNYVFHNLVDTHVLHHLLPTIPHYHAMEATKAIKPILGKYYHFDGTPVYKAVWREAKECIYVEQDEGDKTKGVFWYNNKL